MSIDFHCVQCQTLLRVDDSFAGQAVQCSQCGQTMTVPAAPAVQPLPPSSSSSVQSNPFSQPLTGGRPAGFAAGPVRPPRGIGEDPAMRLLLPVGRSGWAIAAGYLGLLSFIVCPAPIALVIGLIALHDIKKHPEKHGLGRAWFGVIAGGIGTLLLLISMAGMFFS